ncbi:MAG: TonB-dependent receptor [Methylococcales bacterium]|nr:TonB-dependent receptor [Methylococcales bacterium]
MKLLQIKSFLTHRCIVYTLTITLALTGGKTVIAEENQVYELPPLNVIANPVIKENYLDAFSSISSVVTEDQLRDQNALDLASALRRTPGVQITRFNPVGSFGGNEGGGVFVRGMGVSRPGSEIKTYIDDIPLYMGVWGHPLLDLLPVHGMESISVYKSPQPQINGNNFASINLTSKRAYQEGLHGSTRISGGIFSTFSEQSELTGKYGNFDFMLAQGYARSDGHRDNADGELANVMGNLNYQINNNWLIGTSFLYTKNIASDPGDDRLAAPIVVPKYETEAGMVTLNLSHEYEAFQGHLKLYHTTGEGNWFNHPNNPPFDNTITDTFSDFDTFGIRWQEQITPWNGGTFTVGVDSDWFTGEVKDIVGLAAVNGQYDIPTFQLTSPYISVSQSVEINDNWALVPSAGIRYYSHNIFNEQISPHAGLSLVSDKLTLYVNISRGINYPGLEVATLSQFIPPLSNTWQKLDPEQVDHGEIGFKARPFESTEIDVSFFNDRVKNRYIFAFPPAVAAPTFTNFGTYTMQGFEVSIRQDIAEDWSVFGSLTMLDPSIDNLPYTPDRAVSAGINGKISGVHLAIDSQYQSETITSNRARAGGANNTDKVGSFVIFNARVSYPIPLLGEKGEVFIVGENLTDRKYSYREGYPMPGIWGQIGFSASF